MAACTRQLAGNPARPASRGTFRATAVKPRPTFMSFYAPARWSRAVRGQGALPLARAVVPSVPPAKLLSPRAPLRAYGAQSGVQGAPPARPASREACRRAAVKPRLGRISPEQPRAQRARCGVQGGERKRVPSGHNRRRRLATGSRQPKRGFDTAVSKTTIEVADHCPCYSSSKAPV